MKFTFPLYAAMLGGGLGGLYLGLTRVARFAASWLMFGIWAKNGRLDPEEI